jgi:alkanesulfonate monooxygenase SsuD/methylene tetrahydromethanopterin reductase-like flavin-dependent oxidoreductase (luciferase family)
MYPSQFWLALGSGEYLNVQFTARHWPLKKHRNAKLKECTEIIRMLLDGKEVSHEGYTVDLLHQKVCCIPSIHHDCFKLKIFAEDRIMANPS